MKKYVVTASLMAGLSMVSGAAFAQTGSVGVNAVRIDTDLGDADAYGVDGEVIFATGGGWSTILEGSFDDVDGGDSATAVQGHLVNLSGNSAWGGFVGVTDTDGSTVFAIGGEYAQFFDASTLALRLLGDSIYSNMLVLGAAWQQGLLPLSEAAILKAIELNGAKVAENQRAFQIGRWAMLHSDAAAEVIRGPGAFVEHAPRQQDYPRAIRRKLIRELTEMMLGEVRQAPAHKG